jgi:hypothetical protein
MQNRKFGSYSATAHRTCSPSQLRVHAGDAVPALIAVAQLAGAQAIRRHQQLGQRLDLVRCAHAKAACSNESCCTQEVSLDLEERNPDSLWEL